jgi:hypothetical protein
MFFTKQITRSLKNLYNSFTTNTIRVTEKAEKSQKTGLGGGELSDSLIIQPRQYIFSRREMHHISNGCVRIDVVNVGTGNPPGNHAQSGSLHKFFPSRKRLWGKDLRMRGVESFHPRFLFGEVR